MMKWDYEYATRICNFLFDPSFHPQTNFPSFWPCPVPQKLMGSINGFMQASFQVGLANGTGRRSKREGSGGRT